MFRNKKILFKPNFTLPVYYYYYMKSHCVQYKQESNKKYCTLTHIVSIMNGHFFKQLPGSSWSYFPVTAKNILQITSVGEELFQLLLSKCFYVKNHFKIAIKLEYKNLLIFFFKHINDVYLFFPFIVSLDNLVLTLVIVS